MNGTYFARLTGKKRNLLALLASSAVLTAGCANMATTASSGLNSMATGATIGGKIHGGNQPVSGATVNLYFAAQSIYGAPTLGATATSASDGTGSFNFTMGGPSAPNNFTCPAGDPLVYVVAKGGNTLNNGDTSLNNTAAAFIAIFPHTCNQLTSADFVDMSEITTVATMAAAQQFFDPSNDGLSADGTGQQYNVFVNLPNTIALMANVASGTGVTSTVIPASTASGTNGVTGVTVTATPEASKINTLANILSACINNASASAAPCGTLFSSAAPPDPSVTNKPGGTTFSPATDTLQAIYYILTNPTNGSGSNLSAIYGLSPSTGAPYGPPLTSAPSDWTIAINYSSTSTCGTGGGGFISGPYDINIDYQDNVWIANSQSTTGNLSQLTLTGAAATCVFLGGGSHGGATIDSNGSVWLASTEANSLFRYSTGVSNGGLPAGTLAFPTTVSPLAVTADGLGNVYFTASGGLYEIPGGALPTTTAAVTPVQISSVVGNSPIRLMPDYQGNTAQSNIWVTSGSTYVSQVSPATSGSDFLNGFITTQFTTGLDSYGLAVTHGNGVYVSSDNNDNYVLLLTGSGTSYAPAWTTASGFAGIDTPTGISIDGANNVWIPNNTNLSAAEGSASEVSASAVALSPAGTGFEKDSSILASGRSSVVDQMGNVWMIGDGSSGSLTEIVGAGVPIYQPYSKGLSNGRFQTIP